MSASSNLALLLQLCPSLLWTSPSELAPPPAHPPVWVSHLQKRPTLARQLCNAFLVVLHALFQLQVLLQQLQGALFILGVHGAHDKAAEAGPPRLPRPRTPSPLFWAHLALVLTHHEQLLLAQPRLHFRHIKVVLFHLEGSVQRLLPSFCCLP